MFRNRQAIERRRSDDPNHIRNSIALRALQLGCLANAMQRLVILVSARYQRQGLSRNFDKNHRERGHQITVGMEKFR